MPNLFIVGAAKCATTTMYEMLARTPDVTMCRRKEPSHFSTDFEALPEFRRSQSLIRKIDNQHWVTDRQEYLSNFPQTGTRWLGEASTTYLPSRTAAANICAFNPQARIIISLRDPIRRAASEYSMRRFIAQTSLSFSEAIREDYQRVLEDRISIFEPYVQSGLYASQVERYLATFPRDQILVEIIDRPGVGFSEVARNLSRFLNVPVNENAGSDTGMANVGRSAKFPALNRFLYRTELTGLISRLTPRPVKEALRGAYFGPKEPLQVSEADKAFLRDVFRPDVERLSALIGEDLGFWLTDRSDRSG